MKKRELVPPSVWTQTMSTVATKMATNFFFPWECCLSIGVGWTCVEHSNIQWRNGKKGLGGKGKLLVSSLMMFFSYYFLLLSAFRTKIMNDQI